MSDIVPATSALLLMDFQNGIVGILGGDGGPLVERAVKVREIARAADMAVMYVRVAFAEADFTAIPPANKGFSAVAANRILPEGSEAAAIHPALVPAAGEEVFTKRRVGAFSTTNLEARLKARGIDTLVLSGIATSGVVLSTLRDAADKDYRCYVLADVSADPDAGVHRVLTEKVFPRQADVIDLAAFKRLAGG